MRKFVINVNGKSYEVEVEEVTEGFIPAAPAAIQPSAPPTSAPSPAPAPAAAPKALASSASGGQPGSEKIIAPMPGNIWEVKVNPGDTVSKGQVVLVLEAMKMENDILAPRDGRIATVPVSKGTSVNAGDVLVTLE